jgi:hypothetical protein
MTATVHDIVLKYIIFMFTGVLVGTIINEIIHIVSIWFGATKCLSFRSCVCVVLLALIQLMLCGLAIELMGDYLGTGDLGFYALGVMSSQKLLVSEIITFRSQ